MTPLLLDHLAAFVPLEILELQKQGGPDEWHFEEAKRRMEALRDRPGASESILYRNNNLTASSLAILVECLAVMAFCPGGVRFGPLRFAARREELEGAY
jgi:hypothetical protein